MKNIEDKKLCYIEGQCAYFTSFPLSKVYGDDWNDSPYELNAGPPYEEFNITKICFEVDKYSLPQDLGDYSVDQINNKKNNIPWLKSIWVDRSDFHIFAGTTLREFKEIIKKTGGKIYVEEK